MSPPKLTWPEHSGVVFALLLVMSALVVSRSWSAPFYHYDDAAHIYLAVEEPWLTPPPQQRFAQDSWRPLLYLEFVATASYRLDYALFGVPRPGMTETAAPGDSVNEPLDYPQPSDAWAPGVRLMNALYHTLAGWLLWKMLRRLSASPGVALFTALAWTGHPMACESVCWIAERKNVLAALFGFAALLAWTLPRDKSWRWLLVSAFYLLALFSKPTALGLLPVFVALEIIDPIERAFVASQAASWRRLALHLAPAVFLSVGVMALSIHSIHRVVQPPGGSVWTAILTDSQLALRYIAHIFVPVGLSFFYAVDPIVSLADPRLWLCGAAVFATFGALVVSAGTQRRLALLGLFWFVGMLGPNWNLIALPYFLQDRYAYAASAGLILALALAAEGLLARLQVTRFGAYAATAALVALGYLALLRSADYNSELTLFFDAVQKQPRSAMARLCASTVLRTEYERASPQGATPDPQLATTLGNALLAQYEKALECPDVENFFEVFYLRATIADLLMRQNRFDAARERLDGWLPPAGWTQLPETGAGNAIPKRSYLPQTLAFAWLVMTETNLRESFDANLTADQRLQKCKQALDAANQSIAAHLYDFQAVTAKARVFIRLSELDAADPQQVRKDISNARDLLEKIPPASGQGELARLLLSRLAGK